MTGTESTDSDTLVSRDGAVIGPILGIHRDPTSHAALWAVVQGPQRVLLVPVDGATTGRGRVQVAHDAKSIAASPLVADPTRLQPADQSRLRRHYGGSPADSTRSGGGRVPLEAAAAEPDLDHTRSAEASDADADLSVVRSEEQLGVRTLEWRPYQRVRLRTVIRSREETHVVKLRWEELVVENEPVSAVERLEMSTGRAAPERSEVELVLHREEVAVTTTVVPYEWVRASRSPVTEELTVTDTVRREVIDIQQEKLGEKGSPARGRKRAKGGRR